MAGWTEAELRQVGESEEVEIAVRKPDGTLRDPVTVWIVRHDDALFVRSAVKGRGAAWFRAVQETHQGHIRAGRLRKDVSFAATEGRNSEEVDAAYRTKYRRYAGRILNSCLTPDARSTTLELQPG